MLKTFDDFMQNDHKDCPLWESVPEWRIEDLKAGKPTGLHHWLPEAAVRVPQFDVNRNNTTVPCLRWIEAHGIEGCWDGNLCVFYFRYMVDAIQFDLAHRDIEEYKGE